LRIRQELRERGIADDLVESGMEQAEVDWTAQLLRVREKRFGTAQPRDLADQARQSRFLHSRGFGGDDIARLFRDNDW